MINIAIDIGHTYIKVTINKNNTKVAIKTSKIDTILAKQKKINNNFFNMEYLGYLEEFDGAEYVDDYPLDVVDLQNDAQFKALITIIIKEALKQGQVDVTELSTVNVYITGTADYSQFEWVGDNVIYTDKSMCNVIQVEKCKFIKLPSPMVAQVCDEYAPTNENLVALNIDIGGYTVQSVITIGNSFNWVSFLDMDTPRSHFLIMGGQMEDYKNLAVKPIEAFSASHMDYIKSNQYDIYNINYYAEIIREIKAYYEPLKLVFSQIRLSGGDILTYRLIIEPLIKKEFDGVEVVIAEDPLFSNCLGLLKLSKFKDIHEEIK